MPRLQGEGKKIAYKVLGKPANLQFKRSKIQKEINSRLVYDETYRVR